MASQFVVDGHSVYAAGGGRRFDPAQPAVLFLHGAGLDHTLWALLARWFAHRGFSVLAPDLPGHGRSAGEPLRSIEAMADWALALIATASAREVRVIGHSMGSLIALEMAARQPAQVAAIALIAAAAAIPVSRELLKAAQTDDAAAIDMMAVWGHGHRACVGGSLAPGLWMLGNAVRVLQRARPGVLYADLSACNDYRGGLAAAAKLRVPATLVLGERDLMTPAKGGLALAAALPEARTVVLEDAGHMLLAERPDEVLAAVRVLAG